MFHHIMDAIMCGYLDGREGEQLIAAVPGDHTVEDGSEDAEIVDHFENKKEAFLFHVLTRPDVEYQRISDVRRIYSLALLILYLGIRSRSRSGKANKLSHCRRSRTTHTYLKNVVPSISRLPRVQACQLAVLPRYV
jgi:hypothetical protein